MWKSLIVFAVVASIFFISSCEGHCNCGKNEVYSNCTNGGCGPKECSGLGNKIGCAKMDLKYCKEGCLCKDGYLRNDNGKCIPKKECPECGGDPNAVAGCGINCGRHCSNYNKGPVSCIQVCYEDACDCRKGYVFDDNIGKCVVPEDCTPTCGINEVYDNCANGGCRKVNCSQNIILCKDPIKCEGGCICQDGYNRAKNGTCVKCPELQCNKPNEYLDTCPQSCPPQICESIGQTHNCPIQPAVCRDPACRCKKGFYRNKIGECICEEDCKKCTGPNEYFSCGGACDNVCATLSEQNQTNCPIVNVKCNEMCYCESGYARNSSGTCIPIDQCPPASCHGDPNAIPGCGVNCGRLCSNYKENNVACPLICELDGCDCKKGYVFDSNLKKCVAPEDCTPTCGINEVYNSCANGGCRKRQCSKPTICVDPIKCEGGCICQGGYTRASNGTCIREDQCPAPTCGINEVYNSCANGGCRKRQCSKPKICVDPIKCEGGCICQGGYTRASNGTCIREDQCPELQCNKPNEYLDTCPQSCPPQTCESIGQTYNCPIEAAVCRDPACRCNKGFYRNKIGECICEEDCKKCTGPNEYFSCGGACDNVCATLSEQNQTNCPIVNVKCNEMCYCESGYARNSSGTCIPIDQCPPASCHGDPNAIPGCGVNCGRLCSNYKENNVACPLICELDGCDCKKGYVFDSNLKKCVAPEDCTPTCGINEVYNSCANGGCRKRQCSKPKICVDPIKCEGGCICQGGYTRASNGTCIREDQCPELQCNKPNEYLDTCPQSCPPQTCESIGQTYNCPIEAAVCRDPACRCNKGFYRNKIGECICEEDCKKCTGPNEYFSCGGACDNVCATLSEQNQTNCPIVNVKCNEMCYCESGYARNSSGTCIPIDQCPPASCHGDPNAIPGCGVNCGRLCSNYKENNVACPLICELDGCDCKKGYVFDSNLKKCVAPEDCTPTCGINEVYNSCANGGCRKRQCSKPKICVDPIKCEGGCICQGGYTRASNGTCIREDQCPELQCNKPNEYLDTCPQSCPPQTCESIGQTYNCPIEAAVCRDPACRCNKGFYRNKIGECICEEDCKKCTGPNEYFSCGGACDNVCATLSEQNQTNCPIVNVKCNEMCYCESGYARNSSGTCIPIDQCPPASCHGDPNAIPGCGVNCGRLCSNYKENNVACPLICELDGCDCKKGYVFDSNLKKCVAPEDCTPTCGINEVYNSCANGGCRKRQCSKPKICVDPIKCEGGCICQGGYTRASNGTCIREDQCPELQCNKPNEYLDTCPQSCPPQTCESIGQTYNCPIEAAVCRDPACRCNKGFYRNKVGECICEEDCKKCTGPNEYFSCGGACDNVCATLSEQNQTNCPIVNVKCNEMCYCESGYARNSSGTCIPIDQCPPASCHGDPNAIPGCGVNCGRLCSNYKENNVACPLICELDGCDCKKGYVFDSNLKKCVAPEDCTPTCGINEVYNSCANGGCRKRQCSKPTICVDPIKCEGGCICQGGYTRASNGTCIREDQCPELQCNKPNEYLDTCPQSCPPQTCESIGQTYNCPIEAAVCRDPACRCNKGFYRNKIGECICEEDCKKCTGPNEYFSCGGACDNVCATLSEQNQTNCPIVNVKCNEMCYCESGYARNSSGTCIPIDQCPPASCHGDPNAIPGCGVNCGRLCSNYKENNVACPLICELDGCDCKKGYVFDSNLKKCVAPEDCTPTCGINEVYNSCANGGCRKRQCSKPKICVDPIKCEGGCICQGGYTRASNGTCIREDQCPELQCNKPNEYLDTCPQSCPPQTCESIGQTYNCPIEAAVCRDPACRCNKGFYRNKIGECICEEDCKKCTGPNEYFSCGGACDNVCATLSEQNQTNCPIVNVKCNEMCYCESGYARNSSGTCIPIDQCPPASCHGDPNAIPGCGVNCGRLCSNYKENNVACPLICELDGCDCKKGYVFDSNLKKCVAPEDCTPTCGINEVYNSCANGGCRKRQCSKPKICVDPIKCEGGCICQGGYTRASNGTCIREDQCPELQCNKPNEYLDTCPQSCPPQTCESIGQTYNCPIQPAVCRGPACRCKKASCGGDRNATAGCGTNCGRKCSDYKKKNVPCPLNCLLNGCDCKDGYVYDEIVKKCVHPKDCCH